MRVFFGRLTELVSDERSPVIALNSVVLPVPLRPTSPAFVPAGSVSEAWSRRRRPAMRSERSLMISMPGLFAPDPRQSQAFMLRRKGKLARAWRAADRVGLGLDGWPSARGQASATRSPSKLEAGSRGPAHSASGAHQFLAGSAGNDRAQAGGWNARSARDQDTGASRADAALAGPTSALALRPLPPRPTLALRAGGRAADGSADAAPPPMDALALVPPTEAPAARRCRYLSRRSAPMPPMRAPTSSA